MSRIGKQPVLIPTGVTVAVNGGDITVKGPNGEHTLSLHPSVTVTQDSGMIKVAVSDPDDQKQRALWGLHRALISNMIQGAVKPFVKQLEMVGVGFRAGIQGKKIALEAGYSYTVELDIPDGIECSVEKNIITVKGGNKQKVGAFAAEIRAVRKPEPYKGKGIKYAGEVIRRKAGKAAKAAGAAG